MLSGTKLAPLALLLALVRGSALSPRFALEAERPATKKAAPVSELSYSAVVHAEGAGAASGASVDRLGEVHFGGGSAAEALAPGPFREVALEAPRAPEGGSALVELERPEKPGHAVAPAAEPTGLLKTLQLASKQAPAQPGLVQPERARPPQRSQSLEQGVEEALGYSLLESSLLLPRLGQPAPETDEHPSSAGGHGHSASAVAARPEGAKLEQRPREEQKPQDEQQLHRSSQRPLTLREPSPPASVSIDVGEVKQQPQVQRDLRPEQHNDDRQELHQQKEDQQQQVQDKQLQYRQRHQQRLKQRHQLRDPQQQQQEEPLPWQSQEEPLEGQEPLRPWLPEVRQVRPAEPLEGMAEPTDVPYHGLVSQHRAIIVVVVGLVAVSFFANACFAAGICLSSALWRRTKVSAVRRYVERLPVSGPTEIAQHLPVLAGGYDCIFSKPLSSKMLLRIEAVVERPVEGCQLTSPLTRRTCVLYSSAASRQLHDGVHPVPVAFAFASVNFVVRLVDSPEVQVEVRGTDVSLFDMSRGRHVERRNIKRVPDDWQDFISSHRTSPHLSANLRTEGATLEFQECTLCVGAYVTMVGELHRDANGQLFMRPWSGGEEKATPAPQRESWRTSWEDWSCVDTRYVDGGGSPTADDAEQEVTDLPEKDGSTTGYSEYEAISRLEKVLVSDNPELHRTFSQWRMLMAWRSRLFRSASEGAGARGDMSAFSVAGALPGGCAAAFGGRPVKTPKDEA